MKGTIRNCESNKSEYSLLHIKYLEIDTTEPDDSRRPALDFLYRVKHVA